MRRSNFYSDLLDQGRGFIPSAMTRRSALCSPDWRCGNSRLANLSRVDPEYSKHPDAHTICRQNTHRQGSQHRRNQHDRTHIRSRTTDSTQCPESACHVLTILAEIPPESEIPFSESVHPVLLSRIHIRCRGLSSPQTTRANSRRGNTFLTSPRRLRSPNAVS